MKTTIDALELLTTQHDELEELLDAIEASDDGEEKMDLFLELADKIAAHSAIEERLFYPAVMTDDTEEQLLEATEEHLAVKRVLADLLEMEASDDRFTAKLAVLGEEIRHHTRDVEEGKLFPRVRRMFTADELAGLGNELMATYEDLIDQEPRNDVPSQIHEAAQIEMGL